MMTEIGIDVSEAQASVDWSALKSARYQFAIIRATQGGRTSVPVGVDRRFRQHIDGALSAGLLVGVYHAFLGGRDGQEQADFFLEETRPYQQQFAFPLAVDVEVSNNQPREVVADRLFTMLRRIEQQLGYQALIYTSQGFWNGSVGAQHDPYFAQHKLWVANYTLASKPALPRCWRDWVCWQYTSKAQLPFVSSKTVDLDRLASGWADTLAVG